MNQQPQPQNAFWINSRVVLKPGPNFKKKFPLTALFIYRFTRLLKEKHNYLFTPKLQLIFYKTVVVVVSFNIFSYKLKGKGTGFSSFSSSCRRLKSRNDGMMYVNQIKVSFFLSTRHEWIRGGIVESWQPNPVMNLLWVRTQNTSSANQCSHCFERIDSWLSFLRRKRGTSSTRQLIWFLSLMDYPFNHSIHFDLNNTWIAHLLSWTIWMVMTAIPLESLSRKLMAPKTKAPLD